MATKLVTWNEIVKEQSEKTGQSVKDIDVIHTGTTDTIINKIKELTPELYEKGDSLAIRTPLAQYVVRKFDADGENVKEATGSISVTPCKALIKAADNYFTSGKKTKTA